MALLRYIQDNLDTLVPQTLDHLVVVAVTMAFSTISGLAMGCSRRATSAWARRCWAWPARS